MNNAVENASDCWRAWCSSNLSNSPNMFTRNSPFLVCRTPYKRQSLRLLIETIVQGLYNFGLPYLCLSAYLEFSTFGGCDLWRNEHGSSQESTAALAWLQPSYL